MLGWLRRKLGCGDHAADLTQDTFVQVMSAAHAQEMHEPRAYLTVIAKRLMFNFWRRRDLEQAYLDALAVMPDEHAPSQEDRVIVLEALTQVDLMLASLPEKVKQVFLLNQLHEMTYAEIAVQLGMPVITVRRYMKRALQACLQLEH
ncbi:ECF sigma factor FemI [Oxalicibacterium faecigallinarum]|uniref:ECF sigma factor FemI n=1 Tax=Oxalicibacterium faecigallinarum TaxID=573741 RepID=A0A8J3AMT8_9BURK|nr:ECF sigma factor FemI [Oxalicibacterium faecigallinarum]